MGIRIDEKIDTGMTFVTGQIFIFGHITLFDDSTGHQGQVETFTPVESLDR